MINVVPTIATPRLQIRSRCNTRNGVCLVERWTWQTTALDEVATQRCGRRRSADVEARRANELQHGKSAIRWG